MKKQFNPGKLTALVAAGIFLLVQTSCKKDIEKLGGGGTTGKTEANATNASLIAYKATSHELAVGYYRTWRDRTVSGNANDPIMTDVPTAWILYVISLITRRQALPTGLHLRTPTFLLYTLKGLK